MERHDGSPARDAKHVLERRAQPRRLFAGEACSVRSSRSFKREVPDQREHKVYRGLDPRSPIWPATIIFSFLNGCSLWPSWRPSRRKCGYRVLKVGPCSARKADAVQESRIRRTELQSGDISQFEAAMLWNHAIVRWFTPCLNEACSEVAGKTHGDFNRSSRADCD